MRRDVDPTTRNNHSFSSTLAASQTSELLGHSSIMDSRVNGIMMPHLLSFNTNNYRQATSALIQAAPKSDDPFLDLCVGAPIAIHKKIYSLRLLEVTALPAESRDTVKVMTQAQEGQYLERWTPSLTSLVLPPEIMVTPAFRRFINGDEPEALAFSARILKLELKSGHTFERNYPPTFEPLRRFTKCRNLRISGINMTQRESADLMKFLNNPDLMAKLEQLAVELDQKKIVCWNAKSATYSHFRNSRNMPADMPPSSRLVGIEINPGPTMNAQSLFPDGLHSIFTLLSGPDFMIAVSRVCKSWSAVGASTSYPPHSYVQSKWLPSVIAYLNNGVHSPLRRHLRIVSTRLLTLVHCESLISALPAYPSLTSLSLGCLFLETSLTPLLSCRSLHHLELTSYADSFSQLYSGFNHNSIQQSVSHLIHDLENNPREHPNHKEYVGLVAQLRVMASISSLTSLNIHGPSHIFLFGLFSTHDIVFRLHHSPIHLKHYFLTEETAKRLVGAVPKLTEIPSSTFEPSALPHLLTLTLTLQSLGLWLPYASVESFTHELQQQCIDTLMRFTQMTHLVFARWSPTSVEQWSQLIRALPHLWSLQLERVRQGLADVIEHLTAPGVNRQFCRQRLHRLELDCNGLAGSSFPLLQQHMIALHTLRLEGYNSVPFQSLTFDQVKVAFDDPMVLPQLSHFVLQVRYDSKQWDRHEAFRNKTRTNRVE